MSSILKSGIVTTDQFGENPINTIDPQIYIEPDGSMWTRIVHHANPASAKFTSSDSFTTQVYHDENRWFIASICNQNISGYWELMIKQMANTGGTEQKFRWIQTTNPMDTNGFEATKAENVTKITTAGYTVTTTWGGCYAINNGYTYLCCNNGSSSSWYGALGCWGTWHDGIPPYASTASANAIKTGYIDLYLRLNDMSIFDTGITCREFIEI